VYMKELKKIMKKPGITKLSAHGSVCGLVDGCYRRWGKCFGWENNCVCVRVYSTHIRVIKVSPYKQPILKRCIETTLPVLLIIFG
jgi:hypothetical protein